MSIGNVRKKSKQKINIQIEICLDPIIISDLDEVRM